MKASSPASARTRRSSCATGTASVNPVPGPGGPGVEDHRIHLHRPHRGGDLVNDQLGMRASAGIDDVDRADEIRGTLGRVLGEELLAVHRVLEPLERHRPVRVRGQEGVPDVNHVPGQVQLGQPRAGPDDPRRARHPQLPVAVRTADSEVDFFLGHGDNLPRRRRQLKSGTALHPA